MAVCLLSKMENHSHEFSPLRTMNVQSPFPQEMRIKRSSPCSGNLEGSSERSWPRCLLGFAGGPAVAVALATRWQASPQKWLHKLEELGLALGLSCSPSSLCQRALQTWIISQLSGNQNLKFKRIWTLTQFPSPASGRKLMSQCVPVPGSFHT